MWYGVGQRVQGFDRAPRLVRVSAISDAVTHPTDPIVSAIQKLVEAEIRHLPVVDEDFRVLGMLSDRDVRTAVGDLRKAIEQESEDFLSEMEVGSIMTANPVCVPPTASVLEIAELLLDERVGALPVVTDDDKLLGIVSYVDVIGHFAGRRARG